MLRRILFALAACFVFAPAPSLAAEGAPHPEDYPFTFEGVFGRYDRGAVQRGYAVYAQVCSSCHSLHHLSYRNLGEGPDGPFMAYRVRNHETGEEEITLTPHGHHGPALDANDNPFVRAIAAGITVTDMDRDSGLEAERPARPSDHFRSPFPNETAARAANGGAYPPDLSVIVLARHGGADYVRSLLLGYGEAPAGVDVVEGKHYNHQFAGGWISMAPPLTAEGQVTYSDDTPATVEQMATDVATFLQWAADPKMAHRKSMGLAVIAFLLALSVLTYVTYKTVWRDQKH